MDEAAGGPRPLQPQLQMAGGGLGWGGGEGVSSSVGCSVCAWAEGGEITTRQMTSYRPFREQCGYCSGPRLWVLFFVVFNFFST